MYSIMIKTEKQPLSNDQDLVFNLFYLNAFSYIVDANLFFIHIQNDLSVSIILFCHTKLKLITEYKEEDCYTDSIENLELVTLSKHISTIVDMFKMHLFNNITIYRNKFIKVVIFIVIIQTYSKLWHDHNNTVSISEINYL